jgi:uncharacterized membrane protein YfcA
MTSLGIAPELVWLLAGLFFLVAMLYSSVGLGGGSTYTAVLTIIGVNYLMIPTVSLALNLIVTFIGMINYWRGGYVKPGLIGPFLLTSMPMAYFGGSLQLSRSVFLWLLLITLMFVVIRIYFGSELSFRFNLNSRQKLVFSLWLGGILGFVAGTVGIGGGIYLVPLLIMFSLATAKEAAAAGAVFIWLNSLSGIFARAQWTNIVAADLLPLMLMVLLGGFAGSYMGSFRFRPPVVQKTLGIVLIIAIVFISRKII